MEPVADQANARSNPEIQSAAWLIVAAAALRTAFGILMSIDAYLKWQPGFAAHYVGYLQNAANAQPHWLQGWFHMWLRLVTMHTAFFISATRLIETAIAIGLLLGFARRITYFAGALFSLLIWSTAESARRYPKWASLVEWAPKRSIQPPPALDWDQQLGVIGGIIVILVFALSTLGSARTALPPTPQNAAAAVSPLSIVSGAPVARAFSPVLPPLVGNGDTVAVTIESKDTTIEIASGVQYQAWTFNGTVPGPILHVRQGQTVNVTLVNNGTMQHSIDFHAAQVAPDVAYRSINPGQRLEFSFVAATPGAFVYHCGTPPVLQHIANGMYGAIIVDPTEPLPPADVSYVLVQSEWYTAQAEGTLMTGDYDKMMSVRPDEVVFNGIAFQYNHHPLTAKIGQRVRLYVINAGPSLGSAFHIIGGMFAAVYPDGDAKHALSGVSTYPIAPGQGVVFDAIIPQPGKYPIVNHNMRDMMIGAAGELQVTP